jgi:pimeloyl-ACP methyl ester carboxylesterase
VTPDLTQSWVRVEAGEVALDGLLVRPRETPSRTLLVLPHPPGAFAPLPIASALARAGAHVVCAANRYARNDALALLEIVARDLGPFVAAARAWGYERVVLFGWSAGAPSVLFYQAQAERGGAVETPDGRRVSFEAAPPADAVVAFAPPRSRARMLREMIDASVLDEDEPDRRDPDLDLYARAERPLDRGFLALYRAAQTARIERITARAERALARLRRAEGPAADRAFVVHRTLADPHFLDPSLDPNGRAPGASWLGEPAQVNSAAAGLARQTSLCAWLSQWSERSRVDAAEAAAGSRAPLLVIENGADDCVPPAHIRELLAASAAPAKDHLLIPGATHLYAGQPDLLGKAAGQALAWLARQGLAEPAVSPSEEGSP